MAEIIELDEKLEAGIEGVTDTAKETSDTPKEPEAKQEAVKEEKSVINELPEKYRGKSVEEIVKMHQESEKLIGRQAQEVGEVRKLADELLKSQFNRKAEEPVKEVDFFDDPKEAIRQAVENNPKVLAAEQYALQAQREQAKLMLMQRHPDAMDIVKDNEFTDWVKSSSIRTKLFQQADAYDYEAADELMSTFKQLKAAKTQKAVEVDTAERKKALKDVSVETSGTNESTKKTYRRADLIRLRMTNPARFEAMEEEINAAYAEGRIK